MPSLCDFLGLCGNLLDDAAVPSSGVGLTALWRSDGDCVGNIHVQRWQVLACPFRVGNGQGVRLPTAFVSCTVS